MRVVISLLLLALLGAATPAPAQNGPPPGAYRTAAAYRQHRPQPGGADAYFPDKHDQLVVLVPQGPQERRLRVAPDSLWGYVSGKRVTARFVRGEEYRLEYADTLCIYSNNTVVMNYLQVVNSAGPRYFFSRGLAGLVFPLTLPYLRAAYGAGNPAFVAALEQLRATQSLADYDRKTGLYRVTSVYRQAAGAAR